MITLEFRALQAQHTFSIGPAEAFLVAGNFVRRLPEGEVVAEYVRHRWRIGTQHFSRYDCHEPTLLHFEDANGAPTERFGPFDHLFVADGTMYADNELFAKFAEETLLWHSFRLETYGPRLVIGAAR